MMNASWWNIHPFVFTQSLFSFQGTTLWRVLPFRKVVGSSGLEPPTSRLSGARSNHLSYEPIFGGDKEARTPDPLLAKQVLSQLSYTPTLSRSVTLFILSSLKGPSKLNNIFPLNFPVPERSSEHSA